MDPNLTADTTDEIIVTLDRQLAAQFAVGASYIWRRYSNFRNNDLLNWDAANWAPVQWSADPTSCPAGASCPTVTYYVPTSQIPVPYVYTNVQDFWRGYQGVELTARKRFSQDWQLNASFSYNDAPMHFDSPAGYVWWSSNSDPTSIESSLNGAQYASESTSSGLGNVFVNARWIARVTGSWTIPVSKITVAGFYNTRQGYPNVRPVLTPTRPFSAGTANVYLDPRGDERLPNFQTLDLHADRPITLFNRTKVVLVVDLFQALNANTILSERGTQNASNANTISSIAAPRVFRFGARVTF